MKLKIYSLLVLLILLATSSCSSEQDSTELQNDLKSVRNYTIQRKTYVDLLKDNKISSVVNNYSIKENKQNKVSGKSTYAEVNDFTIDTEQAIYIEDPNSSYSSYTFEVLRNESQNDNILENLVISFPQDGYYKLTLIRYELTIEQKNKLENGLFIDLGENIITTSTVEDSEFESQFNQKIALMEDGDCFTLLETSCSYGNANHPGGISSGSQCPGYHENIIWTFCNSSNSGGGWDGSGPGNTGSSGNGGNGGPGGPGGGPHGTGNSNNPIVTSPVVGSFETQLVKSFVKQLSPSQKSWWNNIANKDAVNSIKAYLLAVEADTNFANDLIDDMLNFPMPEGEDHGDEFNYDDYSTIGTIVQTLPGRNSFYSHFPKIGTSGMPSSQVYQLVGGHPYQAHIAGNSNYQNACALRVSRALNYSGNPIPVFKNNNNEQKTEKGDDNLNYILDASSLLAYMKKTFPTSTLIHLVNKTPTEIKTALNGKWGIYIMIPKNRAAFGASGHADFWSNTGCLSGCYFDKAKEVYFWELF